MMQHTAKKVKDKNKALEMSVEGRAAGPHAVTPAFLQWRMQGSLMLPP